VSSCAGWGIVGGEVCDAFVLSYTVKTSRGPSPHRVRRIDVADASASVVEWSSRGTASS